jgi:hypothetical protein
MARADGKCLLASEEALGLLFAACSSYLTAEGEWIEQLRRLEEPFSIHMAYLASHLVKLAREGRTEEFPAVCAAVERLLAEGDEEVTVMTKVGLLEDLQNGASHDQLDMDCFSRHLGPLGRGAWDDIRELWEEFFKAKFAREGAM